jgi:hypothetical protein
MFLGPTRHELNPETLQAYEAFWQYALNVRFSGAQRAELRRILNAQEERGSTESLQEIEKAVQVWEKVQSFSPAERERIRRGGWLETWDDLKEQARQGWPEARWLQDAYVAAHPLLAPGNPPLFEETFESLLEFDAFYAREILRQKRKPMDAATRRATREAAAREWRKFSAKQQRNYTMKTRDSNVQIVVWGRLGPEQRLAMRAQLPGGVLTPAEQIQLAQMNQQLNQIVRTHNLGMLQSELNHMQANQQLIMGSAPRWNPASQRYERIGGINTEFH